MFYISNTQSKGMFHIYIDKMEHFWKGRIVHFERQLQQTSMKPREVTAFIFKMDPNCQLS